MNWLVVFLDPLIQNRLEYFVRKIDQLEFYSHSIPIEPVLYRIYEDEQKSPWIENKQQKLEA